MIGILSYIVVALTLIVGLAVFTSNRRTKYRLSALSLAMTYFGAALWALFVQLFRSSTSELNAHIFHQIFAVVALVVPISCLIYAFSLYKRRIISTVICVVASLVVIAVGYFIVTEPNQFYTTIVMSEASNYAIFADSSLVAAYSGIFGIYLTVAVAMIFLKVFKIKSHALLRRGLLYVGCGLLLSVGICLIFNVILPVLGSHDYFWIGPLAIAIAMLFTYFATLKYRLFVNDSTLMQYATYLVVVIIVAILYIVLFFLIFTMLFRGANPSDEIIIFNFIMVVILILLLPSINQMINYVKKMIANNGSSAEEQSENE